MAGLMPKRSSRSTTGAGSGGGLLPYITEDAPISAKTKGEGSVPLSAFTHLHFTLEERGEEGGGTTGERKAVGASENAGRLPFSVEEGEGGAIHTDVRCRERVDNKRRK